MKTIMGGDDTKVKTTNWKHIEVFGDIPVNANAARVRRPGIPWDAPRFKNQLEHADSDAPLPTRPAESPELKEWIGKRVSRLTVLGISPEHKNSNGKCKLVCRCICGKYCHRSVRALRKISFENWDSGMCVACAYTEKLKRGEMYRCESCGGPCRVGTGICGLCAKARNTFGST